MARLFLVIAVMLMLAGCYTPNQYRFAKYVDSTVTPEMTVATASQRLEADGFECDSRSIAHTTTCTRNRYNVLPYSCVERINLYHGANPETIGGVDVPKISCAFF